MREVSDAIYLQTMKTLVPFTLCIWLPGVIIWLFLTRKEDGEDDLEPPIPPKKEPE